MSLLVRAMTSENDVEIMESLHLVRNSSLMGLIHESINVNRLSDYTSGLHCSKTVCYNKLTRKYRKLVCLGQFGLCTDNIRYRISETSPAFQQGYVALYCWSIALARSVRDRFSLEYNEAIRSRSAFDEG